MTLAQLSPGGCVSREEYRRWCPTQSKGGRPIAMDPPGIVIGTEEIHALP